MKSIVGLYALTLTGALVAACSPTAETGPAQAPAPDPAAARADEVAAPAARADEAAAPTDGLAVAAAPTNTVQGEERPEDSAQAAPTDGTAAADDSENATGQAEDADATEQAAALLAEDATPRPAALPAEVAAARPTTFEIGTGSRASFLIDAPLEKIKGRWTRFGGTLTVNPGNLAATRGEITMEVTDLKTTTFGEPDKDARQTDHALNWLEVGSDVSPAARAQHATARFTIEAIQEASPAKLAEGQLSIKAKVVGTLNLHGARAKKTVPVTVTFSGPPDAPTGIRIVSDAPMRVSLKAHDVKPRDLAGRFLSGALDKIGQKIADTVQVSIDLRGNAR